MKYRSKKTRKLKKKMIKYQAKDDIDDNQLERIERLRRKRDILLSRGGKHERSHKKRVGDATNKNVDKRYDTATKAMERIKGKRIKGKRIKEEWADSIKGEEKIKDDRIFDIFSNPTQKEINDLAKKTKWIRFIADQYNKKIYIFDSELMHKKATKVLKIPYDYFNNKYLYGISTAKAGEKLQVLYEGNIVDFIRDNKDDIDWIWKYIDKSNVPSNVFKRS